MGFFLFSEPAIPFWTAVAALAAAATASVTAIYTYLTLKLLRAQDEPKVIIYVRQDPDSPFFLQLVIENIGRGIAFDVKFKTSHQLPKFASGLNINTTQNFDAMLDGPIIDGIPSFEPGGIRVILWGQYGGLTKALGGIPVSVEISYRHGRRLMRGVGVLEVGSFVTSSANERPIKKIANNLEQINKNIIKIEHRLDPLVIKKNQPDIEGEDIG
jgi:hypothetical protein